MLRRTAIVALLVSVTASPAMADDRDTPSNRGAWMYAPCDRDEAQPEACIERLLTQYPGDGAASLELGPQLSKALVAHTNAFFAVASRHKSAFDGWLHALSDNTFSILEPVGSVEAQLQAAYLHKLREMMLASLQAYPKNAAHRDLALQAGRVISKIGVVTGC